MNNLFTRTLTGILIVIFVLGGFWLHPISFFITGLILLYGTQYEYYKMLKNTGVIPQMISGIVLGIVIYCMSTLIAAGLFPLNSFLYLIPLITVIIVAELYRKQAAPFNSLAHTFFSLVYIVFPFSLFPFAAFSRTGLESLLPAGDIQFSPGVIVGFFILLWTNDIMAYLTGISFGHHRLMERISPKKSWEGFIGGTMVTVFVAWFFSDQFGIVNRTWWIVISLTIPVAGTYGDLTESMLKRSVGLKDSGSIMPGHGGFLDRFDSTLMAFPLVYLFISLFG